MANPFDGEMLAESGAHASLNGVRQEEASRPDSASGNAKAFDDWRLYDGVRTRRVFAFLIDYSIILLLMIPVAILVFLLGFVTFGLGWMLFAVFGPFVALFYVAMTMGARNQATVGMQMMGIRLVRLDGGRIDPLMAIVHTVLFWAGNVFTSGLILLAPLFLSRKQTVHDLLLGTVVVRN